MTRPVHWTTSAAVERLAWDGGYEMEVGSDSTSDYVVVTTREGTEFRARIDEAVAR